MTDLTELKAALRTEIYARRRVAHADDVAAGRAMSLAARDHFLAARLHTGAEVISGFRPIRTEIDVTPLMEALHAAGHRLCVPVIEGQGLPLKFRAWSPDARMVEGAFGALVPASGEWLEPQLLIAPLLAFDLAGWRLGYGGGFYDRTLQGLRARRRTLAVGFAYSAQQVDAVPRETTDQPLDAIVTEQGLIRPRGAGQGPGKGQS
ncbi:MAG TPA: 5-formyltetrahydrofolate cyclo-ligase [Thermohalobaculum sp.]|nr:5-formyltetrahydrofolate cyclo-ligase [Thermohalobaculum sp.]